jgi:GT2 family glycosyltransferase
MNISLVMPNYNGGTILRRCFPETHACFRRECPDGEIILVDDASTDDGPAWIEARFPDVILLRQPANQGFGATVNHGMSRAGGDLVLLLNTDIVLLDGWLAAARPHFADAALFAVTFQSLTEQGRHREGANRIVWRSGLPHTLHNPSDQRSDAAGRRQASYPVGGHCLLRRGRFLELGGFDPLFEPFYWEDADLGLRASARGWPTVYEPDARVLHLEQGSIRTHHAQERIRRIKLRNRFLLAWRLAGRRGWWLGRGLLVLPRFAQDLLPGGGRLREAYRDASLRWHHRTGGHG